jgi:Domain of unknown function (DUF4253)
MPRSRHDAPVTDDVSLPEDGPAQIGPVSLPVGQRIYGMPVPLFIRQRFGIADNSQQAVAWVTSRPMADAGEAWLALCEAHPRTGLVPVLLSRVGYASQRSITGEAFGLYGAQDVSLIDSMSAQTVLEAGWDVGEDYLDPDLAEERAPFGEEFPGLAPTEETRLPEATLREAVTAEEPAFLGLVAARRPADIPAAVGWSVFGSDTPWSPQARSLEIAAVLRSWEARFGARPLRIGSDAILRVLVERPPSTLEAATGVAAEHFAFADQCGDGSAYTVRDLAELLVGEPVWHFWWD